MAGIPVEPPTPLTRKQIADEFQRQERDIATLRAQLAEMEGGISQIVYLTLRPTRTHGQCTALLDRIREVCIDSGYKFDWEKKARQATAPEE